MNFLINTIKGVFLGAGAILPGISSGVLCVIFGIYEKLLDSVLYFFSDFKKNLRFLSPLFIGGILGVILFGKFLNYFLATFPIQTKSIFIGLILGSIPSLLQEVNQKEKFHFSYLFYFLVSLFLGIFLVYLENHISSITIENLHFSYLLLCGFIMSVGVVVPGVSSTILLLLLGVYPIYLSAVSTVYLPVLIPIAIGLFFGCLVFMKLIRFFLNHYYSPTFYAIIGFSLGSIFVLLPSTSNCLEFFVSILCILFGFLFVRRLKFC